MEAHSSEGKRRFGQQELIDKLVGKSPTAEIRINGRKINCLLDTGAEVSTVTESFYNEHLSNEEILETSWVKITAANGLGIPYKGVIVADVEVMGIHVEAGIFVVKDTDNPTTNQRRKKVPGIIGSNIIRLVKDKVSEQASQGASSSSIVTDKNWQSVLMMYGISEHKADTKKNRDKHFAKLCGNEPVLLDAGAINNITCILPKSFDGDVLVENLVKGHLPSGVTVPSTYARAVNGKIEVPVLNMNKEDKWLQPKTRVGWVHRDVEEVIPHPYVLETVQDQEVKIVNQEEANGKTDQQDEKTEAPEKNDNPLNIDLSHADATEDEKKSFIEMINRHADVFAKHDDDLGYCDLIPHKISTVDDTPVKAPYRRIPPSQLAEVKKQVMRWLKHNIIRRSSSSYASNIVPVMKADGSLRITLDTRLLNKKTLKDAYPLPRIDETLESLKGAKYFTSLDLAQGYLQCAMSEGDKRGRWLVSS